MAGDVNEDINEVWSLLDETLFYTNAILKGAKNDEGTFYATQDQRVRKKMESVRKKVELFIQSAKQRHEQYAGEAGVGSQADQKFDIIYETLQEELTSIADNHHKRMTTSRIESIVSRRGW